MRLLEKHLGEMEHVSGVISDRLTTGERLIVVDLMMRPRKSAVLGAATQFGFILNPTCHSCGSDQFQLIHRSHPGFSIDADSPKELSHFSVSSENNLMNEELRGKVLGFFRQLGEKRKTHLRLVKK